MDSTEKIRGVTWLEDLEPLFKIFYKFVPEKLQTNIWKI